MKLIIDRKTWANGDLLTLAGEQVDSALLDHTGSRCCLGFLGRACDIDDVNMMGVGTPQFTPGDPRRWATGVLTANFINNTKWTTIAVVSPVQCDTESETLENRGAHVYPDVEPGERYRERLLTRHFREIGIELEFEG